MISLDMDILQLYSSPMQSRRMASRNGPSVTVRFRTQKELALIKKAAKLEGLSFNTFVAGRAALAAEKVIASEQISNQSSDHVLGSDQTSDATSQA